MIEQLWVAMAGPLPPPRARAAATQRQYSCPPAPAIDTTIITTIHTSGLYSCTTFQAVRHLSIRYNSLHKMAASRKVDARSARLDSPSRTGTAHALRRAHFLSWAVRSRIRASRCSFLRQTQGAGGSESVLRHGNGMRTGSGPLAQQQGCSLAEGLAHVLGACWGWGCQQQGRQGEQQRGGSRPARVGVCVVAGMSGSAKRSGMSGSAKRKATTTRYCTALVPTCG